MTTMDSQQLLVISSETFEEEHCHFVTVSNKGQCSQLLHLMIENVEGGVKWNHKVSLPVPLVIDGRVGQAAVDMPGNSTMKAHLLKHHPASKSVRFLHNSPAMSVEGPFDITVCAFFESSQARVRRVFRFDPATVVECRLAHGVHILSSVGTLRSL